MAKQRLEVDTPDTAQLKRLQQRLMPLKRALLKHPIYRAMNSLRALRLFMEHHVFAVWDFMSLLKVLQTRLSCIQVPWLPGPDPLATRLVNEIVLAEESDEDGCGGFVSHFELYRRAMAGCGADTAPIDGFLERLCRGEPVRAALEVPAIPDGARRFVRQTFNLIEGGDLWAISSAFTLGREDLLPAVFQHVVEGLAVGACGGLEDFRYYLRRHIGLDGEEHGPMAGRLLRSLCGSDETRWRAAERAAVDSLEARLQLWDGMCEAMQRDRGPGSPCGLPGG